MSGLRVIKHLLWTHPALTAQVPTTRIMAGVLPQGSALPAIGLTEISGVDRNTLRPGGDVHVTERIQVTVHAATYPQVKALITLVRNACRNKLGQIANVRDVTVHTDTKGPDFRDDEAGIYMQSQDFKVGFTEDL